MAKFFSKQNLQIVVLIILVLGIFAGVYLTKQIQILMSRASDGLTLQDFIAAFGTSSDEDNYDVNLDINQDGKINVIDILYARKDDSEASPTPEESPTPTPFVEERFNPTDSPEPTQAPSEQN